MGLLWNLLGKVAMAAEDLKNDKLDEDLDLDGIEGFANTFYEKFVDIMTIVMPIVLGVILALGVFFCLKLGIAYAKTEKTEDREEAKKRLVGAIIGFGIGIVAAAIMWILFTTGALDTLFGASSSK